MLNECNGFCDFNELEESMPSYILSHFIFVPLLILSTPIVTGVIGLIVNKSKFLSFSSKVSFALVSLFYSLSFILTTTIVLTAKDSETLNTAGVLLMILLPMGIVVYIISLVIGLIFKYVSELIKSGTSQK